MSMREIKNAVNNTTGELIYFKGHAKATFMSDGSTVEDAIKNIKPNIDLSDYVKSEELEGYAKTEDIPSLEGYAKSDEIPSLDGYVKTEDIPSLDGLVKSEDLPNFDEFAKTEDIPSLDGYAKTSDIPSLDGYAKTEDIPSLDGYASKEWVNNRNYATEYDLKTIDYSTINNVPVSEDETGELNITDESGNIGMKIASEAVYAKDFIAGEHKLSEKVDKTYVDGLVGDINSILESIISGGANTQQENPISYGLPTRAAEWNYFYSLYPVESDITITADYYHPSKGDQTLICHISKGNTKIDETLTAAYEFTNVVITPESDSKYIYKYNS